MSVRAIEMDMKAFFFFCNFGNNRDIKKSFKDISNTPTQVALICRRMLRYIQFPKMNVSRLLSYQAKLLFSEGRGRM